MDHVRMTSLDFLFLFSSPLTGGCIPNENTTFRRGKAEKRWPAWGGPAEDILAVSKRQWCFLENPSLSEGPMHATETCVVLIHKGYRC